MAPDYGLHSPAFDHALVEIGRAERVGIACCVGCKTGTAHESKAGKREPVHERRSVRKMEYVSRRFPDSSVPEALLQLIHHLVNGESCRPLAGRKLLECLKELSDIGLSAIGEEGMIDDPIPIGV
jgi:hypothetical protein